MPRNPIPYIGGKAAMAPLLVSLLPPHHCYLEVFGGVAHLLFRKERSPIEAYNDRDGRLVNLFHVLRDHFDDFAARLNWTLHARSPHAAWRRIGPTGDPIEDALRTYYLLKTSYNGEINSSWTYGKTKSQAAIYESAKRDIEAVSARFRGVSIEERDFRELIPRWDGPDTLFFCDPPYYGPIGEQFWVFTEQDHADLATLLHQVQGKVLLTYYDHPEVRRLYADWHLLEHARPLRCAAKWGHPSRIVVELILANYPIPAG